MSFKVDSGLSNSGVRGNPECETSLDAVTLYRQRSAESTHLTTHGLVRIAGITDKSERKSDLKTINLQCSLKLTRRGVFLVIKIIVGRSAEWRTKREESKKRISVPSPFLSSPFFYVGALFCSSRGPFYIKSCESMKWPPPKKATCSHSIWTCSEGLLTKLTGRSHFPTLFSGLFP